MRETRLPGENRHAASHGHYHTMLYRVSVSSTPRHVRDSNITLVVIRAISRGMQIIRNKSLWLCRSESNTQFTLVTYENKSRVSSMLCSLHEKKTRKYL